MAISHNLSDISNQLSCVDPVAGISGTVGRSWLMWKIFDLLRNFDSNVKLITNSDPTPTFLQNEVGVLTSEPAQSRSTANDTINFYLANDPGLSQNPKSVLIFAFKTASVASYNSLFEVNVSFKIEGGTKTTPIILTSGSSSNTNQFAYGIETISSTFTDMSLAPKLLLWKSSNANLIMGIRKSNGDYYGSGLIVNPSYAGYKTNIGSITEGLNFRAVAALTANPYHSFYEGFGNFGSAQTGASPPSGLSPLTSAGSLPTALLTWGGNQYAITSKLRIGITDGANVKAVSDEIEGLYLVNPNAVAGNYGTISLINNKYYLKAGAVHDGRETHRIILELGSM
ncbi:MAG: hypothetical protein QXD05_00160 [Candidatus Pacearchaeota archaeon]